jgi:hypothetical protein
MAHGKFRRMISPRTALTVALCGIAALTAQTPAQPVAPAGAAAPAKPIRSLEYAFSVSENGMTSYEFNGINGGVETASGAGNASSNSGGDGTMFVDVMSVAPDGSLVVRISELVRNEPRRGQAYTCNVYGNTAVFCPAIPAPSAAEWVLLSYLGREFIDGAPWSADGHWQRSEKASGYDLQESFTLVDAGNGKKVVVQELRKMDMHNGGFASQSSTVTIDYDRAMEVPDHIRDEVVASGANAAVSAHYDFTLLDDSFAKKPH